MALHPIDIRHQEFSSAIPGYKKKEVRDYLEQLAKEIEELNKHQEKEIQKQLHLQQEVRQEATSASQTIDDLKRREELISRTLVFAEKSKADIIANARKEAENIIQEAEIKAKRAIQEARQYLSALEQEYMHIKEQKRHFLMQFKAELQTFMDRINKDPLLGKEADKLINREFSQIKENIDQNSEQPCTAEKSK